MKTKLKLIVIGHLLSIICLTAFAQGTAFTYQGQLDNNGSPASGTYNLTFTLFNTNTTGVSVAGPVTTNGVIITNGLFTVTIDFGSGVFNGTNYWLQIGVETNLRQPLHHADAAPAIDACALCDFCGEFEQPAGHPPGGQPGRHLWRCGDFE